MDNGKWLMVNGNENSRGVSSRYRLPRKLAVVSHILPPATVGTAMRLFRLFRDVNPDDYCLLATRDQEYVADDRDLPRKLPARHYRLPAEWRQVRQTSWRGLRWFADTVNTILRLAQRARSIARIVRQEKCGAILAISGDLIDLPAGYLASLVCRVPFYAEVDDYYSCQWPDKFSRRFAGCAEPLALKGAAGVIVLNEFMRDEYRRRYNIAPMLVYNPYEAFAGAKEGHVPWPAADGEIAVVYTGAIYRINMDAFTSLISAIDLLRGLNISLRIYTGNSSEELLRASIRGPVVFNGHGDLPTAEIFDIQRRADILFLPLGFDTPIPEVTRTTASFKMSDYMISGRPILVHAPADSFMAWYFVKHECGLVVDKRDPHLLAQAVEKIVRDADLRRRLVENARKRAREDFDLRKAQGAFVAALSGKRLAVSGKMRILFVGMPESIHVARWIAQLSDLGWDIHLFPSRGNKPHPLLRNVKIHDALWNKWECAVRFDISWPMHIKGMTRLSRTLERILAPWNKRERRLARVIRKVRPDIIHSLEIQHAGYLTLDARRYFTSGFPPWIAQNWGSDIYLFGRLSGHEAKIKAVLAACDYYGCECERDVKLGCDFGFRGETLPVLPNAGGYDLRRTATLRQPGATSARRLIALKGYQGWAGRALVGLRAIELAADALRKYNVAVFCAPTEDVHIAGELMSRRTGIPIEFVPCVSHEEIMALHGRARMSIGLSIGDAISTSLLEAMIMGSFPIQSNTSAAAEWVKHGESALIVHPDDPHEVAEAIRRAATDDCLVDGAAKINAREAEKRLDQAVIKPQVVAMYERIKRSHEDTGHVGMDV